MSPCLLFHTLHGLFLVPTSFGAGGTREFLLECVSYNPLFTHATDLASLVLEIVVSCLKVQHKHHTQTLVGMYSHTRNADASSKSVHWTNDFQTSSTQSHQMVCPATRSIERHIRGQAAARTCAVGIQHKFLFTALHFKTSTVLATSWTLSSRVLYDRSVAFTPGAHTALSETMRQHSKATPDVQDNRLCPWSTDKKRGIPDEDSGLSRRLNESCPFHVMSRFSFKDLFHRKEKVRKSKDEAEALCSPPSPPHIALRGPRDFAIVRRNGAYRLTRLADRGSARLRGRRRRPIASELATVPESEDESSDDQLADGNQDHSQSLHDTISDALPTAAPGQLAELGSGSAKTGAHPAQGSASNVLSDAAIERLRDSYRNVTAESMASLIQFADLGDCTPKSTVNLEERSSGHALSSSTAFKVPSHDGRCDTVASDQADITEQVDFGNGEGMQTGLGNDSTHDLAYGCQIHSTVERVGPHTEHIDPGLEREKRSDAIIVETVVRAKAATVDNVRMPIQNAKIIGQHRERDFVVISEAVNRRSLHNQSSRPSNLKQEGSVGSVRKSCNIVEHPIAISAPADIQYLPEEWRKEINTKPAAKSPARVASSISSHAEGYYRLSPGSVPWKFHPRFTNLLNGNTPDDSPAGLQQAEQTRTRTESMGGIMQAFHDGANRGLLHRQLTKSRTRISRKPNDLSNSSLTTSIRAERPRPSITRSPSSKTRMDSNIVYTAKSAPARILLDRISLTYVQALAQTLKASGLPTFSPDQAEVTIDDWPHIQQKGVDIKLPHGAQGVPRVLRHQLTGQLVVVKREALARLAISPHQYGYTLGREISSLIRLNSHPNIVKCFFHVQDPRLPLLRCMVLEFCEGGDLHNLITHWQLRLRMRVMPRLFILHFISSMADAIAYMHHGLSPSKPSELLPARPVPGWESVIHSDIKPPNIFLRWGTPNKYNLPDIVLGDLGMSGTEASLVGNWSGTTGYEATEILRASILTPEYYADKHIMTPACDIYGFGATLYQLVTGSEYMHRVHGGQADISVEYARHGILDFLEQDNNIHMLTRFCLHELAPLRYSALELYAYGQRCKLQMGDLVGSARRIHSSLWPSLHGSSRSSHVDDEDLRDYSGDSSYRGDSANDADESDAAITTPPPPTAPRSFPASVTSDTAGPSTRPLADVIVHARGRARARRQRSVVFCRCPHHSTDSLGVFDERTCLLGYSVSTLDSLHAGGACPT
nr:serine/threonine-protein kinase mark1 [Quercus suber]